MTEYHDGSSGAAQPPQPRWPVLPTHHSSAWANRPPRLAAGQRTSARSPTEDAALVRALGLVLRTPSVGIRLVYLAAGFAPLVSLGAALADVAPLPLLALVGAVPVATVAVLVSLRAPGWGRRALVGILAGILATAVYDLFRAGLIVFGIWQDPIPMIGRMLLGGHANEAAYWWVGYAWRYVADGGAMGAAYAALPRLGPRTGAGFGVMVGAGLLVLLAIAPQTRRFMSLSPATAAGAMTGHLIYGVVLGGFADRRLNPHIRIARSPDLLRRMIQPLRASATLPNVRPSTPEDSEAPNGGNLAALMAAGAGCAVLGMLALAAATSGAAATMLTYHQAGGPLTGISTLASLIYLLAWSNLHVRLAGRHVDPRRALLITLGLVGVGLLGTFPPFHRLVSPLG